MPLPWSPMPMMLQLLASRAHEESIFALPTDRYSRPMMPELVWAMVVSVISTLASMSRSTSPEENAHPVKTGLQYSVA